MKETIGFWMLMEALIIGSYVLMTFGINCLLETIVEILIISVFIGMFAFGGAMLIGAI